MCTGVYCGYCLVVLGADLSALGTGAAISGADLSALDTGAGISGC